MSSYRRRSATIAAVLVAFALVGGPVVPARGSGSAPGEVRLVAQPRVLPIAALLDPSPASTPGVPPAGIGSARLTTQELARARAAAPTGRVVALTFDDGPDSRWTPQVLALLARYHAHATFCIIGRQVRSREALVRAIVAQGHTLCNHSWSHDEQLATRATARITQELTETDAALRRAAPGAPVPWFRAPGGTWGPALGRPMASAGLRPLDWTVDPRDWDQATATAGAIVARVLAGLRPGAVVDLHDGGGDRSQTVAALRALLPLIERRGYTCVAVTPAMAARSF